MEWVFGGVLLLAVILFMSYRSDKRAMSIEADKLASEVREILFTYKNETGFEEPVLETHYLLGFLSGYVLVTLGKLGLEPRTIRAHDLVPNIFAQAGVGAFNKGQQSGLELFLKADQLALENDKQFLRGNENGIANAALKLNSLKAEVMSHHLVQSAFKIASERGADNSYETIAKVHRELLFSSYAPKSRRIIQEIAEAREADPTPFPFGD